MSTWSLLPSRLEFTFILKAYNRYKKLFPDECTDLCSHFSERHILYRYNSRFQRKKRNKEISPILRKSFSDEMIELTTESNYYDSLVSEFLMESNKMHINDFYLWCQSLLIRYHSKKECPAYLALSLKFKLLAFEEYDYTIRESKEKVMETMISFLNYIYLHKLGHAVFKLSMEIFLGSFRGDLLDSCLLPVLPKVLEISHQYHFNFFHNWSEESQYFSCASLICLQKFLVLVKYGHEDVFNLKDHLGMEYLIYRTDLDDLFGFQLVPFEGVTFENYRSFQVLLFFVRKCYDQSENSKCHSGALEMLWDSVPDPYLTESMFFSCFPQSKYLPAFRRAWEWYRDIVWVDAEPRSAPRTLKHITRCLIRRMLTMSIQLPYGVEQLDIPMTLRSYITLDHLINFLETFFVKNHLEEPCGTLSDEF